RKLVALGAQAREDALAVDERLRAAERDEGNARRGVSRTFRFSVHGLPLAWAGGRRQARGSHAAAPGASLAPRQMSPALVAESLTIDRIAADHECADWREGKTWRMTRPERWLY